jgi:hypothetical protein
MIAVALLCLACSAPLLARRLTGDLFPPTVIVLSTWAGTLGLLALNWLPYVPMSAQTWWLLSGIVAVLAVTTLAGTWAAARLVHQPRPVVTIRAADTWVLSFALLGVAGLAWYVYSVVSRFGWIFDQGEMLRYRLNTLEIPSHYLFLQQCYGAGGLLAWGLWLGGTRLGRIPIVAAALAAAGTLVTTDRTQFFALVISAVFMYLLRHGWSLRLGRLLFVTVLAPLLLVGNFLIVGAWTGKSTSDVGVRLRWPGAMPGSVRDQVVDALQGGAVVYFYATGSYPALNQYLEGEHPRTEGLHSFYPVARLLQRTGVLSIELPPAIPGFVTIGTREDGQPLITNAYTFLFYPLEDFGTSGAVVYAAIVGLLCGAVYGWARAARGSPARLLLAGQVSMALALTVFVNKFNNTAWLYVLALTLAPFVVTRLLRRDASTA